MFPVGLEPATFRVWGGRDNHYTTKTVIEHAYFPFVFHLAPCVDLKSNSF